MSSFLKSLFASNKHKKLCEEWTNTREPVVDGVTFYVRYLGSSVVEDPKSASSTSAGVKRVIHAAKARARRPERVSLRVAMEGVKIDSTSTGEPLMDISIYKIAYCSADSRYDQVLAFVASNDDETCECHAFLCSKRKVAEAIAVSIAQAFTMAYECWKLALEAKNGSTGRKTSLTSEQLDTRVNFPYREDCKVSNISRSSSPEHSPSYSSPPSEVSSTSGYQSSTTGGLLLDLDESEAGSDAGICVATARKHWTSFDDLCDRSSSLQWSSPPATRYCPAKCSTDAPVGLPPAQTSIGAPAYVPKLRGQPGEPVLSPQDEQALTATPGTRSQNRSNCWPACIRSSSSIANPPHPSVTCSSIATNKFSDEINSTNITTCSSPQLFTSTNQTPVNSTIKVESEKSFKNALDLLNISVLKHSSNFSSLELTLQKNCPGKVDKSSWERFDQSPSHSKPVFFPPLRSLSPLSAFLDSCLTPKEEAQNYKFMFSSGLSGESRSTITNESPSGLSTPTCSSSVEYRKVLSATRSSSGRLPAARS